MAVLNHTHKLKRYYKRDGTPALFCADAVCTFKCERKVALGKKSICWRCGNEFTLTVYNYSLDKPHCADCQQTRQRKPKYIKENLPHAPSSSDSIEDLRARLGSVKPDSNSKEIRFETIQDPLSEVADDDL